VSDLSRLNEAVGPLVKRAQAGDPEGFEELVRQCHQQIYRWALVQTGDSDDAEDVTQEVLVRLYKGIRRYHARSRFTTWLYQVTRNASAEFHRRRKSRQRTLDRHREQEAIDAVELATDGVGGTHAGNLVGLVRSFLHDLPTRQREVFDLVDLQEYAPVEVSKMMKMKPVTVRAHLFRARRAMRERILARHPDLIEDYQQ
jgi:RNA polymerase sigma-70 factor (ECF subfamily)